MTPTPRDPTEHEFAAAVSRALTLVRVGLPHLSGLAQAVRVAADARVPTAGVFASGRLLINPAWFAELSDPERAFVVGHELLHLALSSHQRSIGTDAARFNHAHDLIINDILEQELGMPPPGGGVRLPGARHQSVESLMLSAGLPPGEPFGRHGFARTERKAASTSVGAALTAALQAAGAAADALDARPSDLLPDELEHEWFAHEDPQQRLEACESIALEAAHAVATRLVQQTTGEVVDAMARHAPQTDRDWHPGPRSAYVDALVSSYRPPWELAVHRWIDTVSEPTRTYTRASRRGADRTDVCLPGRTREGRTLSIILDTSGSMTGEIAHALGAIMTFGRATQIQTVRLVQCDSAVTADDVVDIDRLVSYKIAGYGGSDMSPAMHHLADDPDVTAVVVITDGEIHYPEVPMPYDILWVVYPRRFAGLLSDDFDPPYGHVVTVRHNASH